MKNFFGRLSFVLSTELERDCTNGASTLTSATLNAKVSVNGALAVSLSDSANGASVYASAAANALVRNFVSHSQHLL